jgi:ferric-dicitrate binding protein FerR (iron transport regulator)
MNEEAFYRQLVQRYLQNTATDEELTLFFALMKEGRLDQYLAEGMDANTGVAPAKQTPVKRITPGRVAAAAIILILLSAAGYWLIDQRSATPVAQKKTVTQPLNDIAPGSNKAVLTLADGRNMELDSAGNGVLTQQGNTNIVKLADGQVTYQANGNVVAKQVYYNMLTTPRGGQYRLTLPDGTQVWLNAASSIRYPTVFTGNERNVEITGEAYFEVATLRLRSGQKMPFKVAARNMKVEVLGTHFNINAYNDEPITKTTLLEGKVKVVKREIPINRDRLADWRRQTGNSRQDTAILQPGEQAQISEARDAVRVSRDIDVDDVMAWKNGYFSFTDANITDIMRQAARWYNVEVVYEGNISDEYFSGQLPRTENISSLLKFLELTKTITCRIQDKKIIIRPNH